MQSALSSPRFPTNFLSSELAAMNVKVMLDIQPVDNRL